MRQAYKDVLDTYASTLLLTEILADKERQEQIADTVEQYPITKEHQALVDEVMKERAERLAEDSAVLLKTQQAPGLYTTRTNGRGQMIVEKKREPQFYGAIEI
jgi:hypothetical protein